MLEPSYSRQADRQLDELEADPERDKLYREVVVLLHHICEDPNSRVARGRQLRTSGGERVQLVDVIVQAENENWCIQWAQDGDEAVFAYIGPWPPRSF